MFNHVHAMFNILLIHLSKCCSFDQCKSEGALSQNICVLNLHICRLVCEKYYTHKSRGLLIMNESNIKGAELTPSYVTYILDLFLELNDIL